MNKKTPDEMEARAGDDFKLTNNLKSTQNYD